MRVLSLATVLMLSTAPAALLARTPGDPQDEEIVRSLPSDRQIDDTAGAMDRALDALLDVHVGEVADAVDPGRPNHGRNETVGEMASHGDPNYRERMHHSVGEMTNSMHEISDRMAVLAPALRRSMKEFERSIKEATRDLPRDDYR